MASGAHELEQFVREALLRGMSRDQIDAALADAGWARDQVKGAMAAYADVAFPIPVPRPRASLSAREAFLYLLLFSTLYLSAWHLGSLLFDAVDRAFPNGGPVGYTADVIDQSVRWSVATLIIAVPVFLFTSYYIARRLAREPIGRLSPVRRWLTYLTLFLTACLLIGDMTTLVYNLLGGELTVRFILKVVIVGAIGGAIFGYYLSDLRREEKPS